jgi:hypothetical protein
MLAEALNVGTKGWRGKSGPNREYFAYPLPGTSINRICHKI